MWNFSQSELLPQKQILTRVTRVIKNQKQISKRITWVLLGKELFLPSTRAPTGAAVYTAKIARPVTFPQSTRWTNHCDLLRPSREWQGAKYNLAQNGSLRQNTEQVKRHAYHFGPDRSYWINDSPHHTIQTNHIWLVHCTHCEKM